MKVAKFGGTSLANAEQIKKVCDIIVSDPDRRLVVVSAPGKRYKDDIKVTDLLISLAEKCLKETRQKQNLMLLLLDMKKLQKTLIYPMKI